jgi:hypothetical protein
MAKPLAVQVRNRKASVDKVATRAFLLYNRYLISEIHLLKVLILIVLIVTKWVEALLDVK